MAEKRKFVSGLPDHLVGPNEPSRTLGNAITDAMEILRTHPRSKKRVLMEPHYQSKGTPATKLVTRRIVGEGNQID